MKNNWYSGWVFIPFLAILVAGQVISCFAQPQDPIQKIFKQLSMAEQVPENLLANKSVVLFDPICSEKELNLIQQWFQRTGIDAVLYFPIDVPHCNRDVTNLFTKYLIGRNIRFLIFLTKKGELYDFVFSAFNGSPAWVNEGQSAWHVFGYNLIETMQSLYRVALASQKKSNFLINEFPENNLILNPIIGNRGEFFAIDLRVDRLAVVRFGDETWDKQLEDFFKNNYPFQYTFFDPNTDEKEIRKKGYLYTLSFIHTRGSEAMDLLGYDMNKVGNSLASVSYSNGQVQLKTLPASERIYKFYFKHLENGNLYLGTRWDADEDWLQALQNHIRAFKNELRIN